MQKQMTIGLAVAAIAVALSAGSKAMAADASGTANATMVAPISMAATSAMEFASLAATTTAGTVVLSTAGARSGTDVDVLSGGSPAAAVFTVSGANNATYSLTLPSTPQTLTSGGDTMTLTAFTEDSTETLNGSGSEAFNVGATLNVGISQPAGSYTGTYTVTVAYN